jgi:transcriptional regulator with XRE-family HTH domain
MTTVRNRTLGRELRLLREAAQLKPEAAAQAMGWSRSKISRLETAKVDHPRHADIKALLDLYGVTSEKRDTLLQLTKTVRRRGWWTSFGDVLDDTYVVLEDEARLIRSWQLQVIPGLLQTEDYARAVLDAARPGHPDNHKRVQARMARRPLLARVDPPAPRLHVILEETVIRRTVGGRRVMRAQLSELWAAAQRPNVTVQILPFEAGAHAGVDGRFVLFSFLADDLDIGYVESNGGDVYLESIDELTRLRSAWERLAEAALSPRDSEEMISELT